MPVNVPARDDKTDSPDVIRYHFNTFFASRPPIREGLPVIFRIRRVRALGHISTEGIEPGKLLRVQYQTKTLSAGPHDD